MNTILIVEDTLSQLELISHYLRESGYAVIGVTNAKEAVQRAIDQKPDLILTDVVMPGMSGFELCRTLKRHPETARIPIVFCTSKAKEIDRIWGMRQGADAYITKPFTREQLIDALQVVSV
jgi:two-component system, chemotaxis family, response regulator PixH